MTEEKKAAEGNDEKNLDKMTVKDLREIAKDIPDVTGVHGMKKDELLAIVKDARGIKEEKPAKKTAPKASKTKKSSGKKILTVKEMKLEIARLRQEKEGTKDTQARQRIRRRMNRLRKKTRKGAAA